MLVILDRLVFQMTWALGFGKEWPQVWNMEAGN